MMAPWQNHLCTGNIYDKLTKDKTDSESVLCKMHKHIKNEHRDS